MLRNTLTDVGKLVKKYLCSKKGKYLLISKWLVSLPLPPPLLPSPPDHVQIPSAAGDQSLKGAA